MAISIDVAFMYQLMLTITIMSLEEAAHVAAFVARLQAQPTLASDFFSDQPADITDQLSWITLDGQNAVRLAHSGDRLVGVLGVNVSEDRQLAQLYGPLVDAEGSSWSAVADWLYAQVLRDNLIPPGSTQWLLVDIRHTAMADFADRHRFVRQPVEISMRLERPAAVELALQPASARVFQPADQDALMALHSILFSGPHRLHGADMIAGLDDHHQIFVTHDHQGRLTGYAFGRISRDAAEGYIDYLGVTESARRQGLGAALIRAAVTWMLADPHVASMALTVMGDNQEAISLYERLGFRPVRALVSYCQGY